MLTKIADPRPKVELEQDEDREIFVSVSGWKIVPFVDKDGNMYEFATRPRPDGVIKCAWFKVE